MFFSRILLILCFLLFLVFYRCSFVSKRTKTSGSPVPPGPWTAWGTPQDPMQAIIFGFAKFIADQRDKGNLYSKCNAPGIYRSDAYAAATYLFAFRFSVNFENAE